MLIDNSASLMSNLIHGNNGFHMDRMVKDYLEQERYQDKYGLGSSYYDNIINRYNEIQNSAPVRTAKALYRRMVGGISNMRNDSIRQLDSISSMQNPPPVMYRYLFANPMVRDLRYKDRVSGYREVYNDPYGKEAPLETIKEYRQVIDGLYLKEGEAMSAIRYYEGKDSKNELTIDEQYDIFYSWCRIEENIKHGKEDPTDRDNGAL